MLMAGKNPMWVARQMGHTDWSLTPKRYARWIPGHVRRWQQSCGRLVTVDTFGSDADLIKQAQDGDVKSQYALGFRYAVPDYYSEAAKWFRKAADQGHAHSRFSRFREAVLG